MSVVTLGLILLSSIGFLLSGFFSVYLLSLKKNRSHLHLLLGGLFLVLSLRVGKSVFYNFTELHVIIKNLGLAANLAIGPFLLLYGKALMHKYELRKKDLWHFFPAGLYVLFSPLIPNQTGNFYWYSSYIFVIIQQLLYLAIPVILVQDWKKTWSKIPQKGFAVLWIAISIMWLTYLLIFVQLLPVYIFGALAYSVLVIVLAYFLLQEENIFTPIRKYKQSRLSSKQSKQYLETIQENLAKEKSYLNPELSINDLADQVDLSSKVISQVINEQLGLNFSAFINTYRIEEAKRRLTNESYQQFTIASIAYDCGFNSISSFNTSFKVFTKQTPSQFRKTFQKK